MTIPPVGTMTGTPVIALVPVPGAYCVVKADAVFDTPEYSHAHPSMESPVPVLVIVTCCEPAVAEGLMPWEIEAAPVVSFCASNGGHQGVSTE
jgi:hypothetical protein